MNYLRDDSGIGQDVVSSPGPMTKKTDFFCGPCFEAQRVDFSGDGKAG